jgi:hypothetical protein
MNQMSVEHWNQPMNEFLTVTRRMLQCVLLQQLDVVFLHYKQTALYLELKSIMISFLDRAYDELCCHAAKTYFIEHSKPFTMAIDALERTHEHFLEALKERRRTGRVNLLLDLQQQIDDQEPLENDAKRSAAAKITDTDIGPDGFGKEVEIMAVCKLLPAMEAVSDFLLDYPRLLRDC